MIGHAKRSEVLKLQSYKLDNQALVSKINELNELKSQLSSTLSKHHTQEHSIISENVQLKTQNQKLREQISNLQFTKKSQDFLILQLQQKLEDAKARADNYQNMLQKEVAAKRQMQDIYEQKFSSLAEDVIRFQTEHEDKIKVSEVVEYQTPADILTIPFEMSNKTISSIQAESHCSSGKKIRRLKKPSIQPGNRPSVQVSQKYQTDNIILQKQEDSFISGEDLYLQMIRQLYKQLLKIEIKGRDLLKIPQINSFNRLKNPSRNDLSKFFSNYPLQIRQTHKVNLIYDFILKQSQRKGQNMTGLFIISQIIQAIEEIQDENGNKQQSFDVSELLRDSYGNAQNGITQFSDGRIQSKNILSTSLLQNDYQKNHSYRY